MNALEKIRKERGLTYEALGGLVGYPRPSVFRHCHANPIPQGAAARYHAKLGIPLEELRPDLFHEDRHTAEAGV